MAIVTKYNQSPVGLECFVYFNLHNGLWSLKAMEGINKGRVIAHAAKVVLANAKPKVSEKGRQRVIKEKRKNVHAGIVGVVVGIDNDTLKCNGAAQRLYYNPYVVKGFMAGDTVWVGADLVEMESTGRSVTAYD